MANYKEIVTKAVVSKGKRLFTSNHSITTDKNLSTILGCWVINHNFNGNKINDDIVIEGSYDVNIWYSYDNDTKTDVIKEKVNYKEIIHMRNVDLDNEEIYVKYNSDIIGINVLKREILLFLDSFWVMHIWFI